MRSRLALRCAVVGAISMVSALSHAQSADDKAAAETHYAEAVELYRAGDHPAALAAFRQAYERVPNYRVLYNIGQLSALVHDYASAVTAYERYLDEGAGAVPDKRKVEVTRELRKLTSRIGRVTVTSNLGDALIAIDGAAAGTTPLAKPVVVSPGAHRITANRSGRPEIAKSFDVTAAGAVAVMLDFPDPQAEVAVAPSAVQPTDAANASAAPARGEGGATDADRHSTRGSTRTILPLVGWGATGALGLATVVVGLFAIRGTNDYEEKLGTFGVARSDLESSQASARNLVFVTTALGVATAVAGGLSLYWTLAPSKAASQTRARAQLGVGPGTMGLRGAF